MLLLHRAIILNNNNGYLFIALLLSGFYIIYVKHG